MNGRCTVAAVALTALTLWACGDEDPVAAPQGSVTAAIDHIELTPAEDTINALDAATQLTAVAHDAAHNTVAATITYTSLDPARATVDASGLVSGGDARGWARIVASAEGRSDTTRVLVRQVVKTTGLTPSHDTINAIGYVLQLAVAPVDSTGVPVLGTTTWKSLDNVRASVDANGLVTANRSTATPARITARVSGSYIVPLTDTAHITVWQIPRVFAINPDTINALNDTIQLAGTATDSNDVAIPIRWKSLKKNVLGVSAAGQAWSLRKGLVQVEGRAGPVADTTFVLSRQIPKTLTLQPNAASLEVGDTVRVVGTARDSNNVSIANAKIKWAQLDPAVVTVNPVGVPRAASTLATAQGPGSGRVRGTFDGLVAIASITVMEADAATHNWDGSQGTDYSDAANWSPAYVPAAEDTAIIPNVTNKPVLTGNATLASLVIAFGSTFGVASNILTLTGNLYALGAMSQAAAGRTDLTGTNREVLGTVSRLKVTGVYSVAGATTVKGDLQIQGGTLRTQGNTLTVQQE